MLGIPYIIAPFEAESQCAFLETNGLVDGTATEDSDSLLFGCQRVYRHLFSARSSPLEFSARQLNFDMGLTADDLITMALFMGSDYTPGVKGIAAVNATEIINCFGSTKQDLERFRAWVDIKAQIEDKIVEHKDRDRLKSKEKARKEKLF